MKQSYYNMDSLTMQTLSEEEILRRQECVKSVLRGHGLPGAIIINTKGCYRNWLAGMSGFGSGVSDGIHMILTDGDFIITACEGAGKLVAEGEDNENWREIQGVVGVFPNFYPGVTSKYGFDAGTLAAILEQTGGCRLGIINPEDMTAEQEEYFHARLPGVELVDVTEETEALRAVKSAEEIESFRAIVKMHERGFEAIPALVQEGMSERELVNRVRDIFFCMGSGGNERRTTVRTELISNEDQTAVSGETPEYPGRIIRAGDRVDIRVHAMGENELFGMLSRSFVLGTPGEETRRLWDISVNAQRLAAEKLVPGATLAQAARAVNEYLTAEGCDPDETDFLHSLGYVAEDTPHLYDPSEHMPLREGNILAVSPGAKKNGWAPLCCGDVYLVTRSGGVRLGSAPQELFRL